ncbi:MAG: hypothetical protein JNL38_39710 [Myxococcales bacterium]|jgi:hypothetical protein|nr:hypothetical protein [Myxococcales bacterium]
MNRAALSAVVLALAASGCTGAALDTTTMPEPVRADYQVFAQKCSKCHTLARPLQAAPMSDEQWEMYVTRMRRQPASGISAEDQTAILRFLHHHSEELRQKKGKPPEPPAAPSSPASAPAPSPSPPPLTMPLAPPPSATAPAPAPASSTTPGAP